MRAVMVLDERFARRERGLLSRLEIGLADEGVRVVHATPAGAMNAESAGLYSVGVNYAQRGLPFSMAQRTGVLVDSISTALDMGENDTIDVVHAWNNAEPGWLAGLRLDSTAGTWDIALDLARATRAGLVLEVWNTRLLAIAPRTLARAAHLGVEALALAPDEQILTRLKAKAPPGSSIELAPWGVHVPAQASPILDSARTPSAALLVESADPASVSAVIQGLARLAPAGASKTPSGPGLMVFVGDSEDSRLIDTIWRAARRNRMLDRLTLVPDLECFREPVLAMDLLLLPGHCGFNRTLVLDALAAGLRVLSGGDPLVSYLSDPRVVQIVDAPRLPEAWRAAVAAAIGAAPSTRAAAEAGREWVKSHRAASAHVRAVLGAYDRLVERVRLRREAQDKARADRAGAETSPAA
jgi:hypothetical protein